LSILLECLRETLVIVVLLDNCDTVLKLFGSRHPSKEEGYKQGTPIRLNTLIEIDPSWCLLLEDEFVAVWDSIGQTGTDDSPEVNEWEEDVDLIKLCKEKLPCKVVIEFGDIIDKYE
jgi:hypothetical protein